MAILAISITPIGTGSTSVGEYVADALRVIARSGLRYSLGAMHTEIEGELEQLLRLVPEIHSVLFARGVRRVSTVMKIDDRKDAPSSMEGKVRSVKERIQQP